MEREFICDCDFDIIKADSPYRQFKAADFKKDEAVYCVHDDGEVCYGVVVEVRIPYDYSGEIRKRLYEGVSLRCPSHSRNGSILVQWEDCCSPTEHKQGDDFYPKIRKKDFEMTKYGILPVTQIDFE